MALGELTRTAVLYHGVISPSGSRVTGIDYAVANLEPTPSLTFALPDSLEAARLILSAGRTAESCRRAAGGCFRASRAARMRFQSSCSRAWEIARRSDLGHPHRISAAFRGSCRFQLKEIGSGHVLTNRSCASRRGSWSALATGFFR